MKTYRQEGHSVDVVAPTGGLVAGMGYLFGSMFGVSPVDAVVGDKVALWVTGCFSLPKTAATSGNAMTVGELVYWDSLGDVATGVASGSTKIGVVSEAAASLDTAVSVRLNGSF